MRKLNEIEPGIRRLALTAAAVLALTGCPDEGTGDDEIGDTGTDSTGDGDGDTGTDTNTESGESSSSTDTGMPDTDTTDTDTDATDTDTTATTESTDTTDTDTSDTDTSDTTESESTDTTDTTETTESETGPDPLPDADEDGIPDGDDPFPDDADLPGQAAPNVVYAHTSSRLFTMNVDDYQIATIGNFTFNQSNGSVTDIAIDRWGVLYAVTFNDLFVCNPGTAACYYLGDLPQSFNGLTMVPPGTIDPDDDTLLGIANSGAWYQMTVVNQQAQIMQIGQYGNGMTSAGDVFSIQGEGTFGAVNKPGVNNGNVIVESNPLDGSVTDELATAVGYTTIYGLAGWQGVIFAFNSGGQIVEILPGDGSVSEITDTNNAWWGAGVFTILPQ
ncbi:MAG: hypothetical protein HC927_08325 [Deltaproteobacteria bacterium]|nr:hypothetical protein [Deltaproteobacteria bacterium]